MKHLRSVINSLANNYTRHAAPRLLQPMFGDPMVENRLSSNECVEDSVAGREYLAFPFNVLEHSISFELREELARLSRTLDSFPAHALLEQCSSRLLEDLESQTKQVSITAPPQHLEFLAD